jgi:HEAT repeat protein
LSASWQQALNTALMLLQSADKARRVDAAMTLCELAETPDAVPAELAAAVPRLLSDTTVDVRRIGLALGARVLPPPEAVTLLTSRVQDPEELLRLEAVGQLADLAVPASRGVFAAALEDRAFPVRFEAARGMAALAHGAGLDVLVQALDDEVYRFRALGVLAELGDVRALPALQRVFGRWLLSAFEKTQAAGALARLGDVEGERYLVERARRGGARPDRPLAVELCGEVKVPAAWDLLVEMLNDKHEAVRGAAARGLGRLGSPAAVEVLGALVEDAEATEDVRLDAAEGLLLLGTADARNRLERSTTSLSGLMLKQVRALLDGSQT